MSNALFGMVEILLVILILGRNTFFTNKELLLFFFLITFYVAIPWENRILSYSVLRGIDLFFYICIYLLEVIFIFRKKRNLLFSAIFTITQNTILAIIWTFYYDLPLLHSVRKNVYLDSIIGQSLLLISILSVLLLLNKKFQFIESFLAINKKYNLYSLVMMSLNVLLIIGRQMMLYAHRDLDYFYLTIILTCFSVICLLIIVFINHNYKKKLEINTFFEEINLLENQNNLYQEFKHDYNNILLGLSEYLQVDDLENAREYLKSVISYSSEITLPTYYFLIKEVPIIAIQSILFSTIQQAKKSNLDVILNIQNFPSEIKIDLIDFIRCLSILTNNALEHSTGKIFISLTGQGSSLQAIVKNTYSQVDDFTTLFEKNYSTKENHAGVGLFIFQKTLNSYTNTSYSVDKDTNWIAFSFVINS